MPKNGREADTNSYLEPPPRNLRNSNLARKLLITLWRYLEKGETPPGVTIFMDWHSKVNGWAAWKEAAA